MEKKKDIQYKERNVVCNNCGSMRCFESYTEPRTHESYLCVQCGFMSHSRYLENSEVLIGQLEKSADKMDGDNLNSEVILSLVN